MILKRLTQNLFTTNLTRKRALPKHALLEIESTVREVERRHGGEIRVAVESSLPLSEIARGMVTRQRAIEVFSDLKVWDTEHNNGVLLYLLLAEHNIEIVADRGFKNLISDSEWQQLCKQIEIMLRNHTLKDGLIKGVQLIGEQIGKHFPPMSPRHNQISDKAEML